MFTTTRPSLAHTELEWEVLRCLPSVWVRATRAEFPLREVTIRWPPRRDGEKLAVCSPGIEPGSLSIQPSVLTTTLWTPHREPAHNELTHFSALRIFSLRTVPFFPKSHLCLKSINIKTSHKIFYAIFKDLRTIFLQCPDKSFLTQFRNVVFQSKYIIIWSTGYYLKCSRSLSPIRMSWIPSAAPINVSEAKFTMKPKSTTALFHHYLEREVFFR